jgi:RHH-type proline utilization regulon transcriptional repressor/proline dehydrogenase/delta 1-pyrroline-5-carboxylate dehydrogenase
MCLAEGLLRIPDAAACGALIRDKIGDGNWQQHLEQSPSLFVHAAAWGLRAPAARARGKGPGIAHALNHLCGQQQAGE